MNTCFKKIFDITNSKQQIKNEYLTLLSKKSFINNNLHNKNLVYLLDLEFCILAINNVYFDS